MEALFFWMWHPGSGPPRSCGCQCLSGRLGVYASVGPGPVSGAAVVSAPGTLSLRSESVCQRNGPSRSVCPVSQGARLRLARPNGPGPGHGQCPSLHFAASELSVSESQATTPGIVRNSKKKLESRVAPLTDSESVPPWPRPADRPLAHWHWHPDPGRRASCCSASAETPSQSLPGPGQINTNRTGPYTGSLPVSPGLTRSRLRTLTARLSPGQSPARPG